MTNHPIIQLNDISAAYDGKTVLSRVNLNVYEHDFLGVIGPNGGGKTTLIKLILGLLKPVSGTIRFYKNGKEVPEITVGYLPQYNSIDKKFPISVYRALFTELEIFTPRRLSAHMLKGCRLTRAQDSLQIIL